MTSPEHSNPDGTPRTWDPGVFSTAEHVWGERTAHVNWAAIGQAIRNEIAVYLEVNPGEVNNFGGPDAWAQQAVEYFVKFYFYSMVRTKDQDIIEDAARQCALGNRAACD